jgi:tol-pal system protein YbgF
MKTPIAPMSGFLLSALIVSWSGAAVGQTTVIESQPSIPGQSSTGSNAGGGNSSNNDALLLLLEQNRNLQTEVQALRALVEEQGYEVRILQRESMERYTNTDTRLGSLEQALAGGATVAPASTQPADGIANTDTLPRNSDPVFTNTVEPSTPQIANNPVTNTTIATNPMTRPINREPVNPSTSVAATTTTPVTRAPATRPTLEPAVLSEQQLYQMAYDSAINSQFERAIAEFDQYLSIYPAGRCTTNAHYWKGQAYLYLNDYASAITSYNLILQQYADSAKVPDAMYGLGVAYEGMGNNQRARELLQDIIRKYPNTGVANLADTRLRSLN